MDDEQLRPQSRLISAGRPTPEPGVPVNQPIVLSSTFHAGGEVAYGRSGNDTVAAFETALGAIEGGRAIAFSSGMAAAAAVIGGLPVGAVVVLPASYYNFHRTLLDAEVALGRLEVRTVDISDTDATVAALDGAGLLWLEVPTNPMLRVADLPALTAAARARGVLTVVDATVATPLGLRPLEHGADVVMHSVTKWLAGHSDLLMGALVARDEDLAERLHQRRTLTGAVPGALESFLALRGLRTLDVRFERATANAVELAGRLAAHPAVRAVHHPSRPDHPDSARIAALLDSPGGLLSFLPANVAAADAVCRRVRLIAHATSLGGVESLIERRGSYPGELAQGTAPELLRLSVGLEHVEDLWADLAQALA